MPTAITSTMDANVTKSTRPIEVLAAAGGGGGAAPGLPAPLLRVFALVLLSALSRGAGGVRAAGPAARVFTATGVGGGTRPASLIGSTLSDGIVLSSANERRPS